MAGNFSTEVAHTGDATLIYVRGEIDIATCERLRDAIEPHLGPGQSVILDLGGVEFIDSSGLHVLEQARGVLTADGGSLVLRNHRRQPTGSSQSPRQRICSRQALTPTRMSTRTDPLPPLACTTAVRTSGARRVAHSGSPSSGEMLRARFTEDVAAR